VFTKSSPTRHKWFTLLAQNKKSRQKPFITPLHYGVENGLTALLIVPNMVGNVYVIS